MVPWIYVMENCADKSFEILGKYSYQTDNVTLNNLQAPPCKCIYKYLYCIYCHCKYPTLMYRGASGYQRFYLILMDWLHQELNFLSIVFSCFPVFHSYVQAQIYYHRWVFVRVNIGTCSLIYNNHVYRSNISWFSFDWFTTSFWLFLIFASLSFIDCRKELISEFLFSFFSSVLTFRGLLIQSHPTLTVIPILNVILRLLYHTHLCTQLFNVFLSCLVLIQQCNCRVFYLVIPIWLLIYRI